LKETGVNAKIVSDKEAYTMPVTVDKDLCIGCGACTGVCPVSALSLDDNGKSQCDESVCIDCGTCIGTCPVSAISEK
jgi:ferredoxin